MRIELPYRVGVAGAQLRMLVLAADTGGCVGVDMESGAFVRATFPGGADDLAPFDVAVGEITEPSEPVDQSRPESVALASHPRRTGSLTPRRAERWLGPLQHPRRGALLGLPGRAVPYWTLAGDRPSLTLVELAAGPQVRRGPFGYECRFTWQGARHQLPLLDRRTLARLDEVGWPRYSARDLQHVLGHRVRRLLVVLTPPRRGYCYKVVASLLPGA
ncbi:MAG TPA: hypothetical protein VG455_02060 [Acidimicrobiales bacterium]|nr:hypothetical protein [Acidimicrobiales bacterium]